MGEQAEQMLGGWYRSLMHPGCGWDVRCPGKSLETGRRWWQGMQEGLKRSAEPQQPSIPHRGL